MPRIGGLYSLMNELSGHVTFLEKTNLYLPYLPRDNLWLSVIYLFLFPSVFGINCAFKFERTRHNARSKRRGSTED